jgi:hypothetical protein
MGERARMAVLWVGITEGAESVECSRIAEDAEPTRRRTNPPTGSASVPSISVFAGISAPLEETTSYKVGRPVEEDGCK